MSLSIQYESVNDANMRLSGTIVLYDGKPVFIREVGAIGEGEGKNGDIYRVYINELPIKRGAQTERKFISSKKFDLAPFPMGFMNTEAGKAVYLSRAPRRQQKQGLSEATLSQYVVGDTTGGARLLRFADLTNNQAFVDCINGKYPSVAEATQLVKDGADSVAFSRCFAIARDSSLPELIYLYHKKDKVGFIMDGKLKLSAKGRCLRESLNEVGVRC